MSEAAASATLKKLPKPRMRGIQQQYWHRSIIFSVAASLGVAFAWKILVTDKRKKAYEDFYRNYDPDEDFVRMVKTGVMSVKWDDIKDDFKAYDK